MKKIPDRFYKHVNIETNHLVEVGCLGTLWAKDEAEIAFDLDGTLANLSEDWKSPPYPIGRVNEEVLDILEDWKEAGFKIVIFTARDIKDPVQAQLISKWMLDNDFNFEVTNVKSPKFMVMYDDRCIRIS